MGLVQILDESVAAASVIEQADGGPHLLDRIRVPAALLAVRGDAVLSRIDDALFRSLGL